MGDRELLLDELARCFARAAVDAYLAQQDSALETPKARGKRAFERHQQQQHSSGDQTRDYFTNRAHQRATHQDED